MGYLNSRSGDIITSYALLCCLIKCFFFAGSVEGTKQGVMQYISTFDKYSFLWTENLQEAYERFMKTNPSLEAFEAELQKYMAIETEVTGIPGVHNIGSLSLETQPLKHSLKAEAASWKAQFAKNLHKQGSEELKALDNYIRETTLKLNRKVCSKLAPYLLSVVHRTFMYKRSHTVRFPSASARIQSSNMEKVLQ